MLLPRQGFYHPVAILVLAAITLSVAVIFYLNSNILFKQPEPSPVPSPMATPSPPLDPSPFVERFSWKTHSSTNLGFSIYHPDNFTVEETAEKVTFTRGIKQVSVTVTPTELKSVQEIGDNFNSGLEKIGDRDFYVMNDDIANDNVGNTYIQINNGKQYHIYFTSNLPEVEIVKSLKFL